MDGSELQRLHELVTRATEATSVEGVAAVLVDEGMAVLGVPIAGVWLIRGELLEIVHFGGTPTGPWQAVAVAGDSPLATCVRTQAPLWLETPAEYAERFPQSLERMSSSVACVCLPLVAHGRSIGGAIFASPRALRLSAAEKTSLTLIARQCAQALERMRLIDAERSARRDAEQLAHRMNGLQVMAARLALARTLDEIAQITLEQAMATLGASAAGMWLAEHEAAALVAQQGMPDAVAAEMSRVRLDDPGVLALTLRTRSGVWIPTADATHPQVIASRWRGVQAVALVPLIAEGRLLGAVGVAYAQARTFERDDRELIETFALHCALAVDRLRLVELERRARRDAESLAQRMDTLQAAAGRLAAERGIEQTARAIVTDLRAALRASGAGLWLVEDGCAILNAHEGWAEEVVAAASRVAMHDESAIAETLRLRQPMWIDREEAVRRFKIVPERWLNVQSRANVPLVVEGRLVGAFSVTFEAARAFDVGDREFLEVYAVHAAQALERVRLVEETSRLAARMTALQAVAARLSAARDFDEIAGIVVNEANGAIGATTVGLWQLEGRDIVLAAHVGSPPAVIAAVSRIPMTDNGALPEAARTRAAQYIASRAEASARKQLQEQRWAVIEAAAFVPLCVGQRLLGVLGLGFAEARSFDVGDREMIELFAGHAAQAIARYRDDRAQRVLAEASSSLAGSLDAASVLERVGELTVSEFADWCFVDVARADGSMACAIVAHADPEDRALAQALRECETPIARAAPEVIASQRARAIERLSPSDLSCAPALERARTLLGHGLLCVPLSAGGRAIGALTWIAYGRALDERDHRMAAQIARAAAASLDNARLYQAEAHAAGRLGKLYELTVALSSARTPEEVANATTRLGSEATGASSAFVWMRDRSGELRAIGAQSPPEWVKQWSVLPDSPQLPAHRVLATGDAIWVESPSDYARAAPEVLPRVRAAGRVRPFMALPLVVSGERRGVLAMGWTDEHHFAPDERTFLAAIARSCEQAIERAELYTTEAHARAAAEAASRTKDEFLAMLGHELRNPLAPIVTALDLMRLRGIADDVRERTVIERQVQHLTRLVDDLLDISRITRGKIELRRTTDELLRAVEPAIDAVGPLLVQYRQRLHVNVPASGLRVDGDLQRLSQVVRNLLTNAAKFTPAGGELEVCARADGAHVELVVSDNGRGIAPELLPHVFEAFVQGAQGAERSGGGLGLGLAIVKNLIELHDGTVVIASAGLGHGTRVTVRLPLALQLTAADPRHTGDTPATRAMRVLVVDDNVDAAAMLDELLRLLGHEPIIAHDGASALALAAQKRPELAILDLGLPGMDGYEVARKLRSEPALARMPVVALTGYAQPADRASSREAGFVEHLVKPIDLQQLRAVMDRFCAL